ncbi:short chain dehydrogenase/reductase, putative [Talaromyces stipitatus ATCC 10500]|uniref:Short chain dehydrogenase/reductase, putative n=1 Tax=Talaromyces stipitatus (strain ATCC 10500 / CBS 375.48 / QM 6759 / NRRL 1006) TaxID=441959 RepID=B8MLY9_TALSN|nr:short chain dehydrogenase/reductase, putative [Talaromyces stipitatus ATCC 10500]EED13501.1 short chain dehydrogenase/reductase, putative [Talaromyces stipitatus ATCC 10500]
MDAMRDTDLIVLKSLSGKTTIITGGANGIGAETVRFLNAQGANIVIADLERTRPSAETLIQSLQYPQCALFVGMNILVWREIKALFAECTKHFGKVDIVVANAGIMESVPLFDIGDVDEEGELRESAEGFRVIDVNIKGTINTLRLALHFIARNQPASANGSKGTVVLVTSTSGYFGSTGVGAYIVSKHGITGLLRASQQVGRELGVRINGVAPFFTATTTFQALADQWKKSGLKSNTLENVATTIALTCVREETGKCYMVAGGKWIEVEDSRQSLIPQWLGQETAQLLESAGKLF